MSTMASDIDDRWSAFCRDSNAYLEGAPEGPLAGLSFGAKDLYDVAGFRTGGGNPDWRDTHAAAESTAPLVSMLVDAGATMVGKTITDEISRGIFGENAFYGTPVNPSAPERVPGGSSSGSAVAAAAGAVDFSLGTDTGGSIRVPSSFCGIFGIRTTHGRIPFEGVLPQAPSFDTLGWMARTSDVFARVGSVIFDQHIKTHVPSRIVIATDAFEVADRAASDALLQVIDRVWGQYLSCDADRLSGENTLAEWARFQGVIQGREAWQTFSEWIDLNNPRFSFEVADNLLRGAHVCDAQVEEGLKLRATVRARINRLCENNTLIVLPTTPFSAPARGKRRSEMWDLRARVMSLACISGLAGTPQVSMPLAKVDSLPIGVSLIGAPGSDELLIGAALSAAERIGIE